MKRDDNALLGKEFVELINTRNRKQRNNTKKKSPVENVKECNEFNLCFCKEKINVDHRIDGKNTVKTIDTYFYNTPITRTDSIIDSESDTISRARMSINGNKRARRLLTEPSQGDPNLDLIT